MPSVVPNPTPYGDPRTPWRFVLSTLGGTELGDITGLHARKIVFGLNRPTTFEATMDITHPVMAAMMNQPTRHLLIKCYKRGKLMAMVETSSGELKGTGDEHSIRIAGTETAYERIRKRIIGKSATGVTMSGDRAGVAAYILAMVNAEKDSKVRMGAVGSTSTITVGPWRYKPALAGIAELGATLNGYDHWITPADPTIDPNGCYGYLNCVALRGTVKPNAQMNYGTGNFSAREYSYQWDTSKRITRDISLPPGYPDNLALNVISRQALNYSIIEDNDNVGMREELIESDLVDAGLRTLLLDDHLAVRRLPRELFTIQPFVSLGDGAVPDFGFDYDIGDIVEGRVVDSGLVMLNAYVRCYQATIDLDDNGVESVTLGMVDEDVTGS